MLRRKCKRSSTFSPLPLSSRFLWYASPHWAGLGFVRWLFLTAARVQDMMTNRERRDYFFFVMKSWRMEYACLVAAAISAVF